MKKISNKTNIATIALVLLISSVLLTLYVPVYAQEPGGTPGPLPSGVVPNYTVTVHAYLSFRPNPVGVGQTILVNMFTTPAPSTNRMHQDFTVTITDPDGNKDVIVMDSYPDDGTAWFEYVVDQVGTWKLKFDFLGTYFPAGRYNDGYIVTSGGSNYPDSVYYKPDSSPEMTLVVQEDAVLSWPPAQLPTDYWVRPVAYENREWWPVLGDYPWRGPGGGPLWDELYPDTNPYWGLTSRNYFTPWVQAPESPHVVWKRLCAVAGLLGGDEGLAVANADLFSNAGFGGGTYSSGNPSIIYAGRAYQTVTKPMPQLVGDEIQMQPTSVWQCYDIRTGEVFWEQTGVPAPDYIEYDRIGNPGGGGDPEQSREVTLLDISRDFLIKYWPTTGQIRANISIGEALNRASSTYYRNGYCLSVQNLGSSLPVEERYRLINWTTFGRSSNFASRVMSNISFPWSSVPSTTDYNVGIASQQSTVSGGGAYLGLTVRAASIKTGAFLWEKTIMGTTQYSSSCNVADHGKIAVTTEQGNVLAWDLQTGNLAWTSEPFEYPWDEPGFGGYAIASAYGLVIRNAYSGIYAFNWDDGSLAWKYEAPAANPYETPYINEDGETMYSWNIGGVIADGKYYAYNTEHSATVPITRGWAVHCINITTGEKMWSVMLPGAASKHATDLGPIADGYLSMASSDGYQYVFGKGKSATTVSAPQTGIPLGQSVMLTGTVLDLSPAQPGTPCVSKDSMAGWMEYLHKQLPIPADVTGVPVSLDTIDPNGNFIHIGDVTTDMSGTFGHMWTPEITGEYKVMATFMGDESYGSSFAETHLGVVEALEPYPEVPEYGSTEWPEYPDAPAYTSVDLAIIAAIVVVAILVVYDIFFSRKRQ